MGRPDLVFWFFEKAGQKIVRRAQELSRAEGARRKPAEYVLDVLINFNAAEVFENKKPPLKIIEAVKKAIQKNKANTEKGFATLENSKNSFVIQTDFGRTLVDIAQPMEIDDQETGLKKTLWLGRIKMSGLAAFAHGYDAYVAYNPDGKVGMVNIRPGLKTKSGKPNVLPVDMAMDENGLPKGDWIKDGRMYVMNDTSTKLSGLHEFLDSMCRTVPKNFTPGIERQIKLDAGMDVSAPPPPPDRSKLTPKQLDIQRNILSKKLENLKQHPELISEIDAGFVIAAEEGVLREFTKLYYDDEEQRSASDFIILEWWKNLHADTRKKILMKAEAIRTQVMKAHDLRRKNEVELSNMSRILARLRYDERVALYRAARAGAEIPVPFNAFSAHGPTPEQKAQWQKFVIKEWYGTLTHQQHVYFKERADLPGILRERAEKTRLELARIDSELREFSSTGSRFKAVFTSQDEADRKKLQFEKLQAERKIAVLEYRVAQEEIWVQDQTQEADKLIDEILVKFEKNASGLSTRLFGNTNIAWNVGAQTISGEAIYGLINGTPDITGALRTSPFLLGESVAAITLKRREPAELTGERMPQTPLEQCIFLQRKISEIYGAETIKYGSITAAIEHDPLKKLYSQYKESLDHSVSDKMYFLKDIFARQDKMFQAFVAVNTFGNSFDGLSKSVAGANERYAGYKAKGKLKGALLNMHEGLAKFDVAVQEYQQALNELPHLVDKKFIDLVQEKIKTRFELSKKIGDAWVTNRQAEIPALLDQSKYDDDATVAQAVIRTEVVRHVVRAAANVDEAVARADEELATRGVRTFDTGFTTPEQKGFFGRVFEGVGIPSEERRLWGPTLKTGGASLREIAGKKNEHIVQPFESPFDVVEQLMQAVHPEIGPAMITRLTQRFMTKGEVKDSAGQFSGAFMHNGQYLGTLHAGDRVIAWHSENAAMAEMRIEIKRAPVVAHTIKEVSGYPFFADDGTLEFFYEPAQNNSVDVWERGSRGVLRKKGSFDSANRFQPYAERLWKFTNNQGALDTVGESDYYVWFSPNGDVIDNERNEKIGKTEAFGRYLFVIPDTGVQRKIDTTTGKFFIDTAGIVWQSDKLIGDQPLGALIAHLNTLP